MYIILNSKLERVGTLSDQNSNGTPFYNDVITQQIADNDQQITLQTVPDTTNYHDPNGNTKNWGHTLDSIYVPYGYPDTNKITEGNSLAYQDPNNGRWYIMRLTSVTDATDSSGNHYKEATGVNLCIWKLGKTVHYSESIHNASSNKAFGALFSDTGWYFDPHSELVGGSADIQFDGTSSSQAMLQQLCQIYGAEIDAYVYFPQSVKMSDGKYYASDFHVALKAVEIKRHLGADKGDRIVYGRNATNIQRNVLDDNLYTRLYVYGPDGATCACEITNNEPFVQDETANEMYNPGLGDFAENYLEGTITSQTMKNPERLAQWGLKQLKIFNHPRANYTVSVSNTLNTGQGNKMVMDANLGDTFRVIDYKMDPVLTTESRVIRKQLSFSNPYANNITLGEYTTVNVVPPSFINDLEKGEYNRVNEILNEIKNNPGALTCTIDKPDGTSWHAKEDQKRFIAHIYVLGQDITNMIESRGYVWQLWQKGQINNDFTDNHSDNGQTLVLKNDININSNADDSSNTSSASSSSSNTADVDSSNYSWNNSDTGSATYINDDGVHNAYNDDKVHFWDEDSNTNSNGTISLSDRILDDQNNNNSNSDSNNDSDDNNSVTLNGNNINEFLTGPNQVTGEVRLLIDTDYISDHQSTNFNTNRIQDLFTINDWQDHWGDSRVGALQFINYNPKDDYYYASLVYYGRNRPKNSNGSFDDRKGHTEIVRLDHNGDYVDSMIMLYSHHNSNFGLDTTTPGGPYIWTTFKDGNQYWLVRMKYQTNSVVRLNNLPSEDKIMSYNEPGCMTYYDNSSDMVLISHDDVVSSPNHKVDFYKAQDLLNNHNTAQPIKSINLVDYGFVPKNQTYGNENYSSQQTFQSSCLHYPYYYFDTGDINMSDQRMIYCINVQSGTKIFSKPMNLDDFNLSQPNNVIGNKPGNYMFAEPETLNWMLDRTGNLWFLYGLNVGYENNRTGGYTFNNEGIPQPNYIHYEKLYAVGFNLGSNNPNHDNNPDHSDNGAPSGGESQ